MTNPGAERVKSVRALSRRSVRQRTGRFLVEGPQSVREVVLHHPEQVVDLYLTGQARSRHADIVEAAGLAELSTHEVSDEVLAAMCDTPTPQGLAAVCTTTSTTLDEVLAAQPRLLVLLTNVRDPGNAGTVIRCADAAGADLVVLCGTSVDPYNPKTVRASAGSLFHVPLAVEPDAAGTVAALRGAGLTVLAAAGDGEVSLLDESAPLAAPSAWLFGNEAHGLDADLAALADHRVAIPIHGSAESLNLSTAAALCLYESARRTPR